MDPVPPFAAVRASQLLVTAIVCHVIATRASREDLYRLAHFFVGLVMVSVAFGLALPLKRTPNTQDRFNWLYVHPVTAGMFLGVALLLCLAFLTPGGLPRRYPWPVYAGSAAVAGAALVATGTRGAAIGILAGVAAFLLTARGPRGRAELIMVGVPVLVLLPLLYGDKLIEFATRGETVEQLESLNSRTDLWTFAYQAVMNRPVFGNGMSSARGLFLDALGLGGGHNIFVNVVVEGGLVGAAIFCLLLAGRPDGEPVVHQGQGGAGRGGDAPRPDDLPGGRRPDGRPDGGGGERRVHLDVPHRGLDMCYHT